MTMQISKIILYHKDGRKRILSFNIGKLNIITGRSHTGKSAIIDIIEYCCGRSDYKVAAGVIRQKVAWYAVLYQVNELQVLIAKPAPPNNQDSLSQVYFDVGKEVPIPDIERLIPNSDDDSVADHVGSLLGIEENIHVPEEGETRNELTANLRHTLFLLFQDQIEIKAKNHLFHRASDRYVFLAIRDTLKYLLGALPAEYIKLTQDQRRVTREIRLLQKKLIESEMIASQDLERGRNLLEEAKQAGLANIFAGADDLLSSLKRVSEWTNDIDPDVQEDNLSKLQKEISDVRKEFRRIDDDISFAEGYYEDSNKYTHEVKEHQLRLQTVGIFADDTEGQYSCPLCSHSLETQSPTIVAVKNSLRKVKTQLEAVDSDRAHITKHIGGLKLRKEDLRRQIMQKEKTVKTLQTELETAKRLRDAQDRILRVVGRVSLYLETLHEIGDTSELKRRNEELKLELEKIEATIKELDVENCMKKIIEIIDGKMTELAKHLELEYMNCPYKFDMKWLTVFTETPDGIISLKDTMGSGENWLGCHLISHLAIHEYLMEHKRPVPTFFVLDQPFQVYFPSTRYDSMSGKLEETTDADITAVSKIFTLLYEFCAKWTPGFQIILLEHANLSIKEYQDSLIEPSWTGSGDSALVPEDW